MIAGTPRVERVGRTRRPGGRALPELIRQASAWAPRQDPEPLALQDLETADGVRWVDIYGGKLHAGELMSLLDPICQGELTARMVRDLVSPGRYPAGRSYGHGEVAITSAFRIRLTHSGEDTDGSDGGGVASVFDPVHLLIGTDWLISCWLPPRVVRGQPKTLEDGDAGSNGLYLAVAESWPGSEGESAADLADLVRRELAIACGYRPPD